MLTVNTPIIKVIVSLFTTKASLTGYLIFFPIISVYNITDKNYNAKIKKRDAKRQHLTALDTEADNYIHFQDQIHKCRPYTNTAVYTQVNGDMQDRSWYLVPDAIPLAMRTNIRQNSHCSISAAVFFIFI